MSVDLDPVFRALADPARRALLDRLFEDNGQTLNALSDAIAGMTRQGVAKHLGVLEAANLVVTIRRGRDKLHYLNPVPIHAIGQRWLGKFDRAETDALARLKRDLESKDGKA